MYGIDEHIRLNHKLLGRRLVRTPTTAGPLQIESDGTPSDDHLLVPVLCAAATTTTKQGFAPTFAGSEDFTGPIIHPQHWPEDLDYADKNIVVIGSGATAVTLIPALDEFGRQGTSPCCSAHRPTSSLKPNGTRCAERLNPLAAR